MNKALGHVPIWDECIIKTIPCQVDRKTDRCAYNSFFSVFIMFNGNDSPFEIASKRCCLRLSDRCVVSVLLKQLKFKHSFSQHRYKRYGNVSCK